jgi:hypothetical protein
LRGEFHAGDTAIADVEDGRIVLKQEPVGALAGESKN